MIWGVMYDCKFILLVNNIIVVIVCIYCCICVLSLWYYKWKEEVNQILFLWDIFLIGELFFFY